MNMHLYNNIQHIHLALHDLLFVGKVKKINQYFYHCLHSKTNWLLSKKRQRDTTKKCRVIEPMDGVVREKPTHSSLSKRNVVCTIALFPLSLIIYFLNQPEFSHYLFNWNWKNCFHELWIYCFRHVISCCLCMQL